MESGCKNLELRKLFSVQKRSAYDILTTATEEWGLRKCLVYVYIPVI